MPTTLLNQKTPSNKESSSASARPPGGRKRAQVQMAESITAIVIVTLLIVFGVIFYSKMQEGSIAESKKSAQALSAVQLAQRLASLPELSCTTAAAQDASCIDLYKARVYTQAMNLSTPSGERMRSYYFELFGNARIELDKVYPEGTASEFHNITIYENNASSLQNVQPTFIPFTVMNSLTHENYLGVLVVSSYSG